MHESAIKYMLGLSDKLAVFKNFAPFIWYRNILYSLDLMSNALTLGDPRETISSVLGKMRTDGTCKLCVVFCALLSIVFVEPKHCINAVQRDVGRGTNNDMSPIPGLRRKWSNGFVIIVIAMLFYRDTLLNFIINIT